MPRDKSQFAWQSAAVFTVAIACVLALNLLKKHDLIDGQTEGLLRLAVNATLGSVLIFNCIRAPIERALRFTIIVAVVAAMGDTLLNYTEDVPEWASIPIIGDDSTARRTLESIFGSCWLCCTFGVVLMAIKQLSRSHRDALSTISELRQSELNLATSNRRLESTLDELESAQVQLVQRERLSALGQMASGIAHDLNNVLTPAVAYADLMMQTTEGLEEDQVSYMACIRQSAIDAASRVQGLQHFYTRQPGGAPARPILLGSLVKQAISMTRPKWRDEPEQQGHHIEIDLELEECASVRIDAAEFRVVVTNLVFNAVESMPKGGTLRIHLHADDDAVVLRVCDAGCGMPDETKERCFEPFYTSKSRGSGLGLSACHGIVTRAGGQISVESRVGEGTEFIVRLPAYREVSDESQTTTLTSDPVVGVQSRLLLVDDDVNVGRAIAQALKKLGADVCTATDGPSAIETLRRQGPFDIVVTDLGMAGMDGRAFIDATRLVYPQQKVAIVSGWDRADVLDRFSDTTPPDVVLQKPPTSKELQGLLHAARETS